MGLFAGTQFENQKILLACLQIHIARSHMEIRGNRILLIVSR